MHNTFIRHVHTGFVTLGAAIRASGAIEARRAPAARDLRLLDIDPESFRKIRF